MVAFLTIPNLPGIQKAYNWYLKLHSGLISLITWKVSCSNWLCVTCDVIYTHVIIYILFWKEIIMNFVSLLTTIEINSLKYLISLKSIDKYNLRHLLQKFLYILKIIRD